MRRQRHQRWRAAVAAGLAFTMLASACADDDDDAAETDSGDSGASDDFEGTTVTIFGSEVEGELQGNQDAFEQFSEDTGITVEISGDRSFETQIGTQIDGGNPPDIALFPQPGKVNDFADDIIGLPDDVVSEVEENFDPGFTDLVTIDGELKGVPLKADLKSLVWYSPEQFETNGYEIPETFDDFLALADTMAADGNTPFCIGIGSDDATGWPMTDWVEDFMLRMKGPDVYDAWYTHEIPFNDPDVVEVGEAVVDLWSQEGYVFGGVENVAATPFADAGLPLLDGDCMMHRQGNFYSANFPEDTEFGPEGQVDAFFLPGSEEHPNITLSGGNYASALVDRPEVMEVMRFLASPEYATARAPAAGFLSPNKNVDTSQYPDELTQSFGEILAEGDPVRFDASDLMPGAVGAGTFWSAAVDITTGSKDVETAFTEVEESWPD
ncbi:MAG: carbohydrate ABC transporter substrate-binding protein [Acidimicrobiales bacterium]|nr:carbohydrate ABC transporter substrate-binding protein [Acidimicrobiales bacterium]